MDGGIGGEFGEIGGILTICFGNDGSGRINGEDLSDTGMNGHNKRNVAVGYGVVLCGRDDKGEMAKIAVAKGGGEADCVGVELRMKKEY